MPFTNQSQVSNQSSVKKYRHYKHSPFQLDHQGVKVDCDEHGKIKMTQEHGNEEFSEITCSASLINRVGKMLAATRKVVYRDDPFKGEEDDHEEES